VLARVAELVMASREEAGATSERRSSPSRLDSGPTRGEPLNVRVPKHLKKRLGRLKFELDEQDLKGNMAELVHMALSQLPAHADEALVAELLAFRESLTRPRGSPATPPD